MKYRHLILASFGLALLVNPAVAGQKQHQPQSNDFFGFAQARSINHHSDYCYGNESCEAPHAGFDPHGDGVHPPMGTSDGP